MDRYEYKTYMYLDFIPSTVNAEINAKIRYCVSEINMNMYFEFLHIVGSY